MLHSFPSDSRTFVYPHLLYTLQHFSTQADHILLNCKRSAHTAAIKSTLCEIDDIYSTNTIFKSLKEYAYASCFSKQNCCLQKNSVRSKSQQSTANYSQNSVQNRLAFQKAYEHHQIYIWITSGESHTKQGAFSSCCLKTNKLVRGLC